MMIMCHFYHYSHSGPIRDTLSMAYKAAEIAIEHGMVQIQDRPMFLKTLRSTVESHPLRELVSMTPLAMPPPTTAIT